MREMKHDVSFQCIVKLNALLRNGEKGFHSNELSLHLSFSIVCFAVISKDKNTSVATTIERTTSHILCQLDYLPTKVDDSFDK